MLILRTESRWDYCGGCPPDSGEQPVIYERTLSRIVRLISSSVQKTLFSRK